MTIEEIKKGFLERATKYIHWDKVLRYGSDELTISEFPKDLQQDFLESVRAYFISENKQSRLDEVVRFAEENHLEYATKDQDLIAAAEGKLYDCVYLMRFAMFRFDDLVRDIYLADELDVGDELEKNVAKLVNAGYPPEHISQVASKAIGIYESTVARMKEEGDSELFLIENVLEVAHKTLDQYLD